MVAATIAAVYGARIIRFVLLLLAVLLVTPVGAHAATRYVTPSATATSAPCSQAAPCTLTSAIETIAQPGEEVVVGAGDYAVGTTISRSTGDISVRGEAGVRPRLTFSGGAYLSLTTSGTLSNLELRGACGTFGAGISACVHFPGTGIVDRLLLDITGDLIAGIDVIDATVRNSAVRLVGPPPGGFQQSVIAIAAHGPAHLRNVTAVATGAQSIGIAVGTAFGTVAYTTQVTNAVARGERSDLGVFGTPPATITLAVTHSNYTTAANVSFNPSPGISVVPTAPNQSVNPAFVDGALPDYHLASGSPLIDAGVDSPANGPVDLDGAPRALGAATDIGAYEVVPPTVTTPTSPTPAPGQPAPAGRTTGEQQAELRAAVADDLPATLPGATGALITLNLDGLPPGTNAAGEVQANIPGKASAAKALIVAKGKATANAAGSARLQLRVTSRGRALLRRLRRAAKARLIVRLKRPGNVQVTITKPVKIRRPSR